MFNKKKYIKHIICLFSMFVALCAFFAVSASAEQLDKSPLGSTNRFEYIYDFAPTYSDGVGNVSDRMPFATFQCDVDYVWYNGGWASRVRATPTDDNTSFSLAYNLNSDYIYGDYGYNCSILFDYDGDFQYEQGGYFFNPVAFSISYDAYTTDDYDEYTLLGTYTCILSSSFGYSIYSLNSDGYYTSEFSINNVPAGCDAIKLKTITFSSFSPYSNDVYYLRGIGFCGANYSKMTYSRADLKGQIPILVKSRQTFLLPQQYYYYALFLDESSNTVQLSDLACFIKGIKSEFPLLTIDDCLLFVDDFYSQGNISYVLTYPDLIGGCISGVSSFRYLSFNPDVGTLYSSSEFRDWRKGDLSIFQSLPYYKALDTSAQFDISCISVVFNDLIFSDEHYNIFYPRLSRIDKNDIFLSSFKYDPTTYDRGYKAGYDNGVSYGYSRGEKDGYSDGFTSGKNTGYNLGYSEGKNDGYNEGRASGLNTGKDIGYSNGYQDGYIEGVEHSYEEAEKKYQNKYKDEKDKQYKLGYDIGHKYGYADGYEIGFAQKNTDGNNLEKLIFLIPQSIGGFFVDILNFELLGVNLMSLLGTFLFLCLVIPLVKKFI